METNLQNVKASQSNSPLKARFELYESILEIIFAILGGFFIFLGWLLGKFEMETASVAFFLTAYVVGGFFKAKEGITETIAEKSLNVEILMILAAIGSAIIGYWEEGAILIFIFAVSGALETYTTNKSYKELTALMKLQPKEARFIKDGNEVRIPVEKLNVGDFILVKPGEQIPADGVITKGRTSVDEAAITGESMPVPKEVNDQVFAGTVNGNGAITVQITKPNSETLFQKIIDLVQHAQNDKSPSQQFIDRFEARYVYIVLIAVGIMMFLPHYLFNWSWNETFYRAMVLLVVASPCAVVASITPAVLSAISNGARNGILFKGGVHLEKLSNIKAVAFDKTGTLTKGKPEVTDFVVTDTNKSEKQYILQCVASIEKQSNHPLAKAIVQYGLKHKIDFIEPEIVEDISGWGIQGKINGDTWKIGKKGFINFNSHVSQESLETFASEGKTVVFVQKNNDVIGLFALKDVIRQESKQAIKDIQKLGVQTVMLTGDNKSTAKSISKEIGIHEYISDCLPEHKVNEIKKLKNTYGTVAMVGDGINDAPALATANVGISMGEGTDVALETADVVLMKNELSKIGKAIQLSKQMNRIVKQNLAFSISIIILLVLSNFYQVIDLPLGVIGHEGSTILVILNSLRLLKA